MVFGYSVEPNFRVFDEKTIATTPKVDFGRDVKNRKKYCDRHHRRQSGQTLNRQHVGRPVLSAGLALLPVQARRWRRLRWGHLRAGVVIDIRRFTRHLLTSRWQVQRAFLQKKVVGRVSTALVRVFDVCQQMD